MPKKSIITILGIFIIVGSVTPIFAVNKLKNPSLETWTTIRQPQYWTVEDTTYCRVYKESTRVFSGNYAAKLIRMQAGTGNNKGLLQQCTLATPARGRYIARVRFYDNNDSCSGGMTITWRQANGTFISSWSTTYTVNASGWQVVERTAVTDTAPANAALADFLVRTYGSSGSPAGGTIVVDSMFFEQVGSGVEENGSILKNVLSLEATPNPFKATTLISFSVNPATFSAVKIYDATGNVVRILTSATQTVGSYKTTWDGRNENGLLSAPGVYFIVLETNNAATKTVKTLYLR
jgi:hypothetical protein